MMSSITDDQLSALIAHHEHELATMRDMGVDHVDILAYTHTAKTIEALKELRALRTLARQFVKQVDEDLAE